jgi:signal transduction histidine kinase
MQFHIALALSLFGSLALAGVLWRWAERVPGVHLLTAFLIGVALWIAGNELPTWFGPAAETAGLMLLATAALTSAVFLHFAIAFTATKAPWRIAAGYGTGVAATALSIVLVPGTYQPFAGLSFVAIPNTVGWITSMAWAIVAGAGQLVLLRALLTRRGLARRQVGALIASSAWGLLCMSGYAIAALNLPTAPWPLLGLPLYPVLLVYGILRYELLLANAWARRALAWTILVAAAGLVVAAVPLLPFGDVLGTRMATALGVGVAFIILGGPARLLAERIVYPGGNVTPEDLTAWRRALADAQDQPALALRAQTILSRRLSTQVDISVGEHQATASAAPLLVCRRIGPDWQTTLESGWEAAPPGPRRVAAMFGAVLAEEAQRLERAVSLAAQERDRQTQARLAELGELAATVAHDVRNPLNIISMAVAFAEPEIRGEVTGQVKRIARLADDLLEYAKPWSIAPAPLDLTALVRDAAARCREVAVETRLPPNLWVLADAERIEQVLTNLLDNARTVASRIMLDAEQGPKMVLLHVCDDGPGVPEDLRDRIFQPFVSRSAGGTGLGLAIVARIVAAHGGSVALTERAGWSTCVTLSLPAAA